MNAIQTVQALVDILDVLPLPEGYVDEACAALDAGQRLLAQLQAGETARPCIPATLQHDEGAFAQCGDCGRYSLDPYALTDRPPTCECGSKTGWCGSFKRPGADARWSGKAPAAPAVAQMLTEDEIEAAWNEAAHTYRMHRSSIRGQQLTPADSPDWHEAIAIQRAFASKNGLTLPEGANNA